MHIHYDGGARWESHIPRLMRDINTEAVLSRRVVELLTEVEHSLKRFDQWVREADIATQEQLIRQECEASWQMAEGDKRPQLFAFLPQTDERQETEVQDLLRATRYGIEALGDWPLCSRLICDVHYLALRGERYDKRYRGEYRTSPIWIGEPTDTLTTAPYVPPVYEDMTEAISEMEQYVNYNDTLHPIIVCALMHYQIEMIHPFVDGNGRIGRLLTQFYLYERGIIGGAWLPLSVVLNQHEPLYHGALQRVHETGDYEAWVYFFLRAIAEAVSKAIHP